MLGEEIGRGETGQDESKHHQGDCPLATFPRSSCVPYRHMSRLRGRRAMTSTGTAVAASIRWPRTSTATTRKDRNCGVPPRCSRMDACLTATSCSIGLSTATTSTQTTLLSRRSSGGRLLTRRSYIHWDSSISCSTNWAIPGSASPTMSSPRRTAFLSSRISGKPVVSPAETR